MKNIKSVLFVCLGNICRSPTAEGVFAQKAAEAGLNLKVDSAGTAGYHVGSVPDNRTQDVALAAGYDLSMQKCRRVDSNDFLDFDLIVPMDIENERNLLNDCPAQYQYKIRRMMSFVDTDYDEVPDPYYSGIKGFELVLSLIERASDALILQIQNDPS
ncbi:MAG: low molecular weight protein-tyrosine-phosphatase [Pseudomonadota bacterium]